MKLMLWVYDIILILILISRTCHTISNRTHVDDFPRWKSLGLENFTEKKRRCTLDANKFDTRASVKVNYVRGARICAFLALSKTGQPWIRSANDPSKRLPPIFDNHQFFTNFSFIVVKFCFYDRVKFPKIFKETSGNYLNHFSSILLLSTKDQSNRMYNGHASHGEQRTQIIEKFLTSIVRDRRAIN